MPRSYEREQTPTLAEKGLWWAKIGGIVAAVLGVIRHSAELAVGGAGVAVVSAVAGHELYVRRKEVTSRT